ncbi:MAG: DUF4159 domain-containing protein [Flavobacteriales bacterium]|nr:DUF4159 domain-containing protein [Flavobacteriales bacterium]MBL6873238.1 DUF4159 domain-containing protein [Flavobacteriales bacterium]
MRIVLYIFSLTLLFSFVSPSYKIAVLKYNGGGDWYSNPTALTNLIQFCNDRLGTNMDSQYDIVEVGNQAIFNYPFIHMTGHGNVVFSTADSENLRNYLIGGGFLHIDDNYGMDKFVRPEMKKVFPESEFVELPINHPIYNQEFSFKNGLPKIHKHDEKPSQGFGLFYEGRMVCFYSYESDLGDGWEDAEVHNDSQETRLKALKMGANIIDFVFSNQN